MPKASGVYPACPVYLLPIHRGETFFFCLTGLISPGPASQHPSIPAFQHHLCNPSIPEFQHHHFIFSSYNSRYRTACKGRLYLLKAVSRHFNRTLLPAFFRSITHRHPLTQPLIIPNRRQMSFEWLQDDQAPSFRQKFRTNPTTSAWWISSSGAPSMNSANVRGPRPSWLKKSCFNMEMARCASGVVARGSMRWATSWTSDPKCRKTE